MNSLNVPNSKILNSEKKVYSLHAINCFLGMLGLLPFGKVPTSKIIIHFHELKLSVAIQPIEVWKTKILRIPNYAKMQYDLAESVYPYTKLMHFDLEFHFNKREMNDKKIAKKMNRINKALNKRGYYLSI